jgi:hypothetical protein
MQTKTLCSNSALLKMMRTLALVGLLMILVNRSKSENWFLAWSCLLQCCIDPSLATVVSNKRYATNPYSNGNFRFVSTKWNSFASAYMSHHQSSSLNNIQINTNTPVVYTEFTLIDLQNHLLLHLKWIMILDCSQFLGRIPLIRY